MGLPLGLDPAEEDRLDEGTRRRDPNARSEYRALLQAEGPKRMARAQEAFAEATDGLPSFVELALVVFQECRDIRQVGVFDSGRRAGAIEYVRSMIPHGRTPLAQSLMVAQEMLGDKPASIVLLTDGREFCSGDPCAVAEHVKATHPGTPIHIIDIAGQGRTECVAEITGGRSYAPAETENLTKVIRAAFRGAAAHCPDSR
jgi:Ca-activated chloride channel homolog